MNIPGSDAKTSEKIADALISRLAASSSYAAAKLNCLLFEALTTWKSEYKKRLRQAAKENSQVMGSYGVPERIEALIAKCDPDPEPEPVANLDDEIPF